MLWLTYNILFTVGFLLILPKYLLRMKKRGGYRKDFAQRFGRYSPDILRQLNARQRIWIHAVSVGEVFVAFKLMDEIRGRLPDAAFVLTVTTSTAHAIAEKKIAGPDVLLYFPVDFPRVGRRALDSIRPKALILVECEFWPNLIRAAHRRGIPVALVNGRISDKSFRGYMKLRAFTSRILPLINPVCAQARVDGDRLVAMGAPEAQLHVVGSAKYEVAEFDEAGEEKARQVLLAAGISGDRTILLGGSTWAGEEAILLDHYKALREKHRDLMLVLVPRHVERVPEILPEIQSRAASVLRRSEVREGAVRSEAPDVFVVDTTGELKDFYASADLIFVGKSLTQHGGQNIVEPALYGKAVVVGPNMENFPVVISEFLEAGAIRQVADADSLLLALEELLSDASAREALGHRAGSLVKEKRGALKTTVRLLEQVISPV
ncbi:MAG: 3-deoxy-D-manno-octulosonic acid transferase [Verrucomicrobia bacterium]|nr:3-deoxy-D-manno-octulosonic acid transferase [Verrucomicrobiota bacterium]